MFTTNEFRIMITLKTLLTFFSWLKRRINIYTLRKTLEKAFNFTICFSIRTKHEPSLYIYIYKDRILLCFYQMLC
jgi:hypothetical protein